MNLWSPSLSRRPWLCGAGGNGELGTFKAGAAAAPGYPTGAAAAGAGDGAAVAGVTPGAKDGSLAASAPAAAFAACSALFFWKRSFFGLGTGKPPTI